MENLKLDQSAPPSIPQPSWYHPSQWEEEEIKLEQGVIIREKYCLEKQLGKGAMGVVWKAIDLIQEEGYARDSHVAIKFLSQDFKQHPDALKALVREFNRYKRLNHPNIIKAHGLDHVGSTFFMVMELLKGVPLDEFIKINPNGLSLSEAEPIIKNMSQALACAHQEGIAHLDFKPANVFYDPETKIAKVIDFGIARPLEQSARYEALFVPSFLKAFAYPYASCEMLLGFEPDPRDDIYGLACVTYELLSGKHPFNGKKATTAKYEKLSPKPIIDLNSKQNHALRRALAFQRKSRTFTANQFLAELFPEKKRSALGLVSGGVLIAIVAGFAAWERLKPTEQERQRLVEEKAARQQAEVARLAAEQEEAARKKAEVARLAAEQEEAARKAEVARLAEAARSAEQKRQQELAKVVKLLKQCKKHLDAQRLTTGRRGTALACYRDVLELDAGNVEALDGLRQIERRYQQWAEKAFKKRDLDKISSYLKGLERVNPRSSVLVDLRGRLEIERENLARKQAEAERLAREEAKRQKAEAERLAEQQRQQAKQAQEIAGLLQNCQKHLDAQRLTTGSGETALSCYQKVLKREAGNAEALEGLQQIERRYQVWAEKAFRNKQLRKISNYLKGLERVNPQSPVLADLRGRLEVERENLARQQQQAKRRQAEAKRQQAKRQEKERQQQTAKPAKQPERREEIGDDALAKFIDAARRQQARDDYFAGKRAEARKRQSD